GGEGREQLRAAVGRGGAAERLRGGVQAHGEAAVGHAGRQVVHGRVADDERGHADEGAGAADGGGGVAADGEPRPAGAGHGQGGRGRAAAGDRARRQAVQDHGGAGRRR